jgi:two-component system, NtrC family, sensor histidine kinase HydH
MRRRRFEASLTWLSAVLVLLIAALAGGALWAMRIAHRQLAHTEAAQAVVDEGKLITSWLARQPGVRNADAADWASFSREVRALHAIENGLQYVSVTKDGVTVFYVQTTALDAARPPEEPVEVGPDKVRMTRKRLTLGSNEVPVVVFATQFAGEDGKLTLVEAALRKEAVEREERTAAGAIASMFKVSLATIVVSFTLCAALVVWMMRREVLTEKERRQQEHLAFAAVLANGIVHDFRNPMSAVRLDVQMLEKEAARGGASRPERLAELAGRIRRTVDRMDKVFQEFLYMSKPPSEERERVDLGACVRDCLAVLAPRFEEAGVRVETDLPDGGPHALAYQDSLQRALMNVITNAEQFAPRGSAVVLRAGVADNRAFVDVTDDGPGVPEADRRRVFEMFYSTRPGGTGLGLFLAKTAVERCGGTIGVESRPEGGARFRITLPLAGEAEHG